ncbi:MAG: PAS domain-containing protein [Candidatus Baltobacteraceae bacterium]
MDFRLLFESLPGMYLILTPTLKIVAVTDAYLKATLTRRDDVVGRPLFEVFPDNPQDEHATGSLNLRASLARVHATRKPHVMALQRYDVADLDNPDTFVEKFWSPVNTPVFDSDGSLIYIIHQVEEVTEFVKQGRAGTARPDCGYGAASQ